MRLIPISEHPDHVKILYDLLAERTPEQSISHKKMPTWEEHLAFIEKMRPETGDFYDRYCEWQLVDVDGEIVGSTYITNRDEIGVSIFKAHQRKGYGAAAVKAVMQYWSNGKGPFYANINPANEPSRKMFEKLGFKLIQHTLALEAE